MSASFSVIIATCARPASLQAALMALKVALARAGGGHRIIVADNGPEATAAAVVREVFGAGGPVRYLRTEPRNKARALNAAIAAADTAWLAFTDDDTLPDADWILEGARFALTAGFRMFGGRIIPGPVERPLPPWLRPGRSGRIPHIGVFAEYDPAPSSGPLPPRAAVPFGANVFIHRAVFERAGGYDEALWALCGRRALGAEDSEFGSRVRALGEAIGYCREALVVHPVRYDRARLGVHFRLAYAYGWREPIIFFDPRRPWFEPYRVRVAGGRLARALGDFVRGDLAGGMEHLVEMTRCAAGIAGRLSGAYRRRAAQVEGEGLSAKGKEPRGKG